MLLLQAYFVGLEGRRKMETNARVEFSWVYMPGLTSLQNIS